MPKKGTHKEIVVQGDYGYGWETVTGAANYAEAKRLLKDYNDNEPSYPHKIGFEYC